MIKLIDSTLALLDEYDITKEQILEYCSYMKEIGIDELEISKKVYHILKVLPEGFKFYLHLEPYETTYDYIGVYRYFQNAYHQQEKVIHEIQMNDVKELLYIRDKGDWEQVRITGLDDVLCYDYIYVFQEIKKVFNSKRVILCPEDLFFCATAIAVEWIINYGEIVNVAFAGCGGKAATEEVYMALNITKRYKPNQSFHGFIKLKAWLEEIIQKKIESFKPIIGDKIFQVESGVHVDGYLKNPMNYVAYPPEKLGKKTEIVLGKHSGSKSIVTKCKELRLEPLEYEKILELLNKVRCKSVQKRNSITESEFLHLYEEVCENTL